MMRKLLIATAAAVALAAPFPTKDVATGGGYFPVLIQLKNGHLLAVLRGGGGHIDRRGRLDLIRSTDRGKTWSKPWVLVDGPEDDRNPALGQLRDGTIIAAYAILSGYDESGRNVPPGRWCFDGPYIMRSRDNGKTWTEPERSAAIYNFYQGQGDMSPYGKIVQLKGGTALMTVNVAFVKPGRGDESYVFRSKDGGKTWGEPGLIGRHYNEAGIAVLPDGMVLAAARSEKHGHLAVSRSTDGGLTWSEPKQVTKDNEHPADLIVLKDGRVLMTFGERNAPCGARALLSRDGGRTWDMDKQVVLGDEAPNYDAGYPSSVEVGRGNIVTMYYQVDHFKNAPAGAKARVVVWDVPR